MCACVYVWAGSVLLAIACKFEQFYHPEALAYILRCRVAYQVGMAMRECLKRWHHVYTLRAFKSCVVSRIPCGT